MSSEPKSRLPKTAPANLWLVAILVALSGIIVWQLWKENTQPTNPGTQPYEPRTVTPTGQPSSSEQNVIDIFQTTSPSVVSVSTRATNQPQKLSTGTGLVWDDMGHIITNRHVIEANLKERDTTLEVHFPGRGTFEAVIVGGDRQNDIAILKLMSAPASMLRPIRLGTSSDLKVGQSVYAIGNPFEFDQTLSAGIIGGLNRIVGRGGESGNLVGLIQTDAAINPGNSGGPLLDSSGRVIGVNTAIVSPTGANSGLGFAVPIDNIIESVDSVLSQAAGNPQPYIGLSFVPPEAVAQWESPELAGRGMFILSIDPSGPAGSTDLTGVRRVRVGFNQLLPVLGDQIAAINGKPTRSVEEFRSVLSQFSPGETVDLTIFRNDQEGHISLTLSAVKLWADE